MKSTPTTRRPVRRVLRQIIFQFTLIVLGPVFGNLAPDTFVAISNTETMTNYVSSFDGVDIAYSDSGGSGRSLIFVHGWSCNRGFWNNQTAHFAEAYRVIEVDLAGHGASGLGRGDWTIEAFARDVRAVAEALDLQGAILIGHSLGGTVVVDAANGMADRVAAVIGVDTFKDITESYTQQELDFFEAALKKDLNAEVRRMAEAWFAQAAASATLKEMIVEGMSATDLEAAVPSALAMADFDYAAQLAALKPPFRLINASSDLDLYEPIRAIKPDFRITFLENVSHFPMIEAPARFNRALDDVLEELAAR